MIVSACGHSRCRFQFFIAAALLAEDIKAGAFIPAGEKENLVEERELLSRLELPDAYFWAVHPLDSVKIEGWIGSDRERMLDALDWSISHVDERAINRTSRTGTL